MYHLSCTELPDLSKKAFWRFFNSFDTVITGCQGVLWTNDKEFTGSSATLNRLRKVGKRIFFLPNNIKRTRDEVVQKAAKMGFVILKNEVISCPYLTANYLKSINFTGTAYVLGSRGLIDELEAAGIEHIGSGPDIITECEDWHIEIDPNVRAVVVGLDEHFSYKKLTQAAMYLNNPECDFIATSLEERRNGFHPKFVVPSTASILVANEVASGRKAKIIGKPSPFVSEYLQRHHCVDPQRTLLLGDRLGIDTLLSYQCGFHTIIVLSGFTNSEEMCDKLKSKYLRRNEKELQLLPDLYTKNLEDLLPYLTSKESKV